MGVDPYLDNYAGVPSREHFDEMGASKWHEKAPSATSAPGSLDGAGAATDGPTI